MTYREPADVPSGLVDSNALAAHVEQLEAEAAHTKQMAEQRREAQRQQVRAKADRKASRVRVQRDHGGTLLSLSKQSTTKGVLIASSLFLVPLMAFSLWALFAWEPEFTLLTLVMTIPLAVLPIMGVWNALLNRRPLHLYATRNGFFTLYRRTPGRAIAIGRIEHLKLDVRNEGGALKKMMPKYDGRSLLGDIFCDHLTPSDMKAIQVFAKSAGIKLV